MEFWATEVKSGEVFKVQPGEGMVLHLSQACIGEIKKEKSNESVCLFVNVNGKKLVLGTLSSEKLPQQQYDLVFDRDFELSHSWKNGSVFFYGYKAMNPIDDEIDDEESDSESEEDIPLTIENNGKPADAKKANAEKDSALGKPKVKIVDPNEDSKDEDDSDEDNDSMSEDQDGSDEDEDGDESGSEDDEDETADETPKKVETGKKRTADSAFKTPRNDKKAKVAPQTDGKKGGGHVATPHPSKQVGKTPANKNQPIPKSAGASHTCKSCSKTFGSQNALESHSKAKHSAGK